VVRPEEEKRYTLGVAYPVGCLAVHSGPSTSSAAFGRPPIAISASSLRVELSRPACYAPR